MQPRHQLIIHRRQVYWLTAQTCHPPSQPRPRVPVVYRTALAAYSCGDSSNCFNTFSMMQNKYTAVLYGISFHSDFVSKRADSLLIQLNETSQ